MMLQQEKPDDFVIATEKQISVREFVRLSALQLGIRLEFIGIGVDECAVVAAIDGNFAPKVSVGDAIVKVNRRYFSSRRSRDFAG